MLVHGRIRSEEGTWQPQVLALAKQQDFTLREKLKDICWLETKKKRIKTHMFYVSNF